MLAPAASERVFSQAGLIMRPCTQVSTVNSMLPQLVFLKWIITCSEMEDYMTIKIYFVLLIAVVCLLLVKFLQVSDSLWLSQNHKIRATQAQCRPNYAKMSKLSDSLEKGLDLALARSRSRTWKWTSRSRENMARSRSRLGLVSVSHHKVSFTSPRKDNEYCTKRLFKDILLWILLFFHKTMAQKTITRRIIKDNKT